jgi:hypothetical protein
MYDLFETVAERERFRLEIQELPEIKVSDPPRKPSSSFWRKRHQLEQELRRYRLTLKHGIAGTPKEAA